MRVVRFIDVAGHSGYGSLQPDGTVLRLSGPFLPEEGDRVQVDRFLAPIEPPAIYAIGLNYRKHAEETGAKLPEYPVVFMKAATSLQNPESPIVLPRFLRSDEVDYEAELAVVIGKTCKNVTPEKALQYVFGYTCANDVSARDWQIKRGGRQWVRGKSFDTFCPLGPSIVTLDELPNHRGMGIRTRVNDEVLQDWNTGDMIFNVPELVSFLSGSTTLLPGTVILTGTPHGVGVARDPQRWLQPGDTVEVEIDGIGTLRNPVVEEAM